MLAKIQKYCTKYWHIVVVVFIAIIFFVLSSSYNYFVQTNDFIKWGSPDETANYVFTKLYGQTGEMIIFEKNNLYAQDIIRPRSFRSDHGDLKPVSFLGIIIIYGSIIAITGYKFIPYLTPLIASISLVFYYLLIKRLFSKQIALLSTIILAGFPVYIYYSSRSMFHNVLFVSLLVISLYFGSLMINAYKKVRFSDLRSKIVNWKGLMYAALTGVFLGLSIMTRTSELIWIAPGIFILWLFNIRKVGITKLLITLCFTIVALLPMACWNLILYGSVMSGGYPEMNQSIHQITLAGSNIIKTASSGTVSETSVILNKLIDSVFVFGFHAKQSLVMFYYYFIKMFYWIFWPFVLGLIIFIQDIYQWKIKHTAYLTFFLIISSILVFYYGSWEFHDNPDPNSYTIGNSYTRYWLPIYMMAIPFVSMFIHRFATAITTGSPRALTQPDLFQKDHESKWQSIRKKFFGKPRKKLISNAIIIIIIFISTVISLFYVTFGSDEGLYYSLQKQSVARSEIQSVLDHTKRNAVIITRYHDKLLFPERKVIVGLFTDDTMNKLYAKLLDHLPVYYYNFELPKTDIDYLNQRRLKPFGYHIEFVTNISNEFSLYELIKDPVYLPKDNVSNSTTPGIISN